MILSTQPYKGTRDFYPDDKYLQSWAFDHLRSVVKSYGYQEYDGPMLEPVELYAAKSGEELVNSQLYSLEDRGNRKLAIRPEMTPTLARMVAGRFQELPKPLRWFSIPNLWRYERPQRGRLREHWQLNVDLLGGSNRLADIEILSLAVALFKPFKAEKLIKVRVNSRAFMNEFFFSVLGIDEATALRVSKLIDAKLKMPPEDFEKGLKDLGFDSKKVSVLDTLFKAELSELSTKYSLSSLKDLNELFVQLNDMGLSDSVVFDPVIMRGMDYYTGVVFEAYDTSPENTRALFGGGRYDNLIGLFGKNQLSGIGFGLGDVSLINFLQTHSKIETRASNAHIYIGQENTTDLGWAREIATYWRSLGFSVLQGLEFENLSHQLKQASKLDAYFCLIRGEDEKKLKSFALKDLKTKEQRVFSESALSLASQWVGEVIKGPYCITSAPK